MQLGKGLGILPAQLPCCALVSINVCSSTVTNVPLWWGMFIMGKAVHVWGQGNYWKSLYILLNFAGNENVL